MRILQFGRTGQVAQAMIAAASTSDQIALVTLSRAEVDKAEAEPDRPCGQRRGPRGHGPGLRGAGPAAGSPVHRLCLRR